MRVLTVRQPWAWAIVHAGKDVENRVRPLGPYRGPVAIQAGLRLAPGAAWSDRNIEAALLAAPTPPAWSTTLGTVLGVVDLVDVHRDQTIRSDMHCRSDSEWHGATPCAGQCSPWGMPNHHHLVLANPRPFRRPFRTTGRLGLWRPSPALEDEIVAALELASSHEHAEDRSQRAQREPHADQDEVVSGVGDSGAEVPRTRNRAAEVAEHRPVMAALDGELTASGTFAAQTKVDARRADDRCGTAEDGQSDHKKFHAPNRRGTGPGTSQRREDR